MATTDLNIACKICSTNHVINVKQEDLWRYNDGAHAQHTFPYLSADDRELIISGVCGKCFDEMFEDDDDES